MVSVQLGSTRRAVVLLAGYVGAGLLFGGIAWGLRDGLAAALSLTAWVGAARMAALLRRRSRRAAGSRVVDGTSRPASPSTSDGAPPRWFVSRACHHLGARSRDGVLLVGPTRAAFVPTERWQHLAWRLLTAPLALRHRFIDIDIDIDLGSGTGVGPGGHPASLDDALHDAVVRYRGVWIDDRWTFASSQRWLVGPRAPATTPDLISVSLDLPRPVAARWLPVPAPSPARLQSLRRRIVAVSATACTLLVVAGFAAWRLSDGDTDVLVACLTYAGLIAFATVGGLVVARRRMDAKH